MVLKVTPCDDCYLEELCKLNDALNKVEDVLALYRWFFVGEEAHLSFKCVYYSPKPVEEGE